MEKKDQVLQKILTNFYDNIFGYVLQFSYGKKYSKNNKKIFVVLKNELILRQFFDKGKYP
jgi:hypothetical protein